MKFKRAIASILTATFLLTLMEVVEPPKTFAEDNFEITAKVAEDVSEEETQKIQKQLNKILKKLDKQARLNELKEKIRELEEKVKDIHSKYKNKKKKKDEKNKEGYFSKNGIKNVLNHPSKIFSAGVYTLFSECLLLSIPLIGTKYAAPLLGFYHIGILMPFIAMIKIGIRLYEDGRAQDNQNNNFKKQKAL